MAITKRIIVLEQLSSAPLMFRYVMWADTPAARVAFYAARQATMVSAWKDAAAGDNTALQNGTVTERVDQATFPAGATLAQAETILQAIWAAWNTLVQADNPWNHYGSFMDASNSWTLGGVT